MDHHYRTHLVWDGNLGDGTSTYAGYGRQHRILIDGKPELQATADAAFRGDAAKHNPEDLFLAAISSCHMLSYLALCARAKINVLAYEDEAKGTMQEDGKGGGKFVEVMLHPIVTVANEHDAMRAKELHDRAHELCFIANSCSVPIHHEAEVRW
ncbi:MAG TPA: OsmC family protein [Thermoanaerobaculia bacterium]|nr:OsmC family protein [Thermoanaerobaculia bacterium]